MEKKYISKTSGNKCTAAQYLAEEMCIRKAKKQKERLSAGFWHIPKWKKFYRSQIIAANSLLKIYDEKAVLNAVKRKEVSWCYSLRIKRLDQILLEEQDKVDKEKNNKPKPSEPRKDLTKSKPRKQFGKRNKINKLRKLDE